jgi:hypothetical protein
MAWLRDTCRNSASASAAVLRTDIVSGFGEKSRGYRYPLRPEGQNILSRRMENRFADN